jgi:glutathione S-transferase
MPPTLVTIAVSHFCEKARWALDHAGIDYREDGHLPIFHVRAVTRPDRKRTTPVLVTEDGPVPESSAIIRWADAHRTRGHALWPEGAPEIDTWVQRFDKDVGPTTRTMGYDAMLPHKRLTAYAGVGTPEWERRALALLYPMFVLGLRKALVITPERVAKARVRVTAVFDAVDAALADGRRFLVGDQLSAADLTWAALSAPLIFPPEYGGSFPPLTELPAPFRGEVEACRARPAGAFALRLYREHRR